jgi:hemerythrin-like domain-containing protein
MQHEIARDLIDAHRNMERVLTLIQLQVDSLRSGTDADGFLLLGNAVGYMSNYPGVIHHPTEELIFGRLITVAPQTRSLCVRLHDQHEVFQQQESVLLRRIRSAQGGDLEACRDIKRVGSAYCAEHANHIRSEELDMFPQAIKWLNTYDWDQIGESARAVIDPALEANDLKQYDNLYDYLMNASRTFGRH